MQSEVIDISSGSQHESYIVVSSDGEITHHVETEDNRTLCLHKTVEPITLAELRRRNPCIASEVEAALARLRSGAQKSPRRDLHEDAVP